MIINDIIAGAGGYDSNAFIRFLGTPAGKLGVARAIRWSAIADKAAVKGSLSKLAEIPDLKVLAISHGQPLRDDVAAGIRLAAAQL